MPTIAEIRALGERLEQEYDPRVARFGALVTLSATPTEIRLDVAEKGAPRPVLSKWVQYARRLGWAGGDVESYRDLPDLEKELRTELDAWIADREASTISR